jgi:hypothetical protein
MSEDTGNLPLAIALIGAGLLTGFMAWRPWPAPTGKPIKPGAYLYEILEGQVPAEGPPAVSAAEVQATEYALDMVLGIWAATKLSKILIDVAQTLYDAIMSGVAGLSALLGAGGGGGTTPGDTTPGDTTPPGEPPPEDVPPVDIPVVP